MSRFTLVAFSCVLLAWTAAAAAEDRAVWTTDVNAAWQKTLETHRPMVAYVGSDGCPHCRRMQSDTWSNPQVLGDLSEGFVATWVDGNRNPSLIRHWNIRLYPTTLVFGDDGRVLARLTGYVSPSEVRSHLQSALVKNQEGKEAMPAKATETRN